MIPSKILVFHTAFIGDLILTLPVLQRLHEANPRVDITVVAVPTAAAVFENHPAVHSIIPYDKRGSDAGVSAVFALARRLRSKHFDVALVPHRSLRSAILIWLARIPRRIGFSTSAAPWLFTDIAADDRSLHEIDRNLSLLAPLGISRTGHESPALHPSAEDERVVDRFILLQEARNPSFRRGNLVGMAPGSVWNTKRWPKRHFIELGKMVVSDGSALVLVGSKDDAALCYEIERMVGSNNVVNAAGKLSLLQSAELIRRCSVLVTNDSAPLHLAAGVRTAVVALFGATAPGFGFAPRGKHDVVVEMQGLTCRPCTPHGGEACPIGTFVCMEELRPDTVYQKVKSVLESVRKDVP